MCVYWDGIFEQRKSSDFHLKRKQENVFYVFSWCFCMWDIMANSIENGKGELGSN